MFWRKLPKPFFVLAPMDGVTDAVFREYIALAGKPDVLYTEFVSCRGLISEQGRKKLFRDLCYTEKQRPIVAQLFGSDPEDFFWCGQFIRSLGFDGLDINMGCPDRRVEAQGAGAALICNPSRARAIIRAAKKGAGNMPVSVKTRIGYNTKSVSSWIGALLSEKPSALIVHLRTRKEMSNVPAHWEEMPFIVSMAKKSKTIVVGNGDISSREEGVSRAYTTGCDGIMIGRGAFGNPRIFASTLDEESFLAKDQNNDTLLSDLPRKKIQALIGLVVLFCNFWGEEKNNDSLKKHFSSYIRGFKGAKAMRMRLMQTKNCGETLSALSAIRSRVNAR